MSSVSPLATGGFLPGLSGFGAVNGWTNTTDVIGSVSTAWATAANWNAGVPGTASDVVINSGTFQPSTGAAVTVKSLTVNSGATLSVTGASNNLTVSGEISSCSRVRRSHFADDQRHHRERQRHDRHSWRNRHYVRAPADRGSTPAGGHSHDHPASSAT